MARLILLFLALTTLSGHAALNLIAQEPFAGPGAYTGTSTGANFSLSSALDGSASPVTGTIQLVKVGAYPTSSGSAPGWSGDMRAGGVPAYCYGAFDLSGNNTGSNIAGKAGMAGAWYRVKTLPPAGGYLTLAQLWMYGDQQYSALQVSNSGTLTLAPFNGATITPGIAIPVNKWFWLGFAWYIDRSNGFNYALKGFYMPLDGSFSTFGPSSELSGVSNYMTSVRFGLWSGGTGPIVRVSCPTVWGVPGFNTASPNWNFPGSDVAYPTGTITPPVEQSYSWYVNPATGNDANDGSTPATAWRSAAKINLESQWYGMLDSNAAGPGGGDVLTIDTSSGPLVIGNNTLTFATQGLRVQPASGQTYIKCQAEEFLANSRFTAAPGLSKTYQTTDTQSDIVAWENDEWMWHVQAASFNSTATVTDPTTGTYTSYANAGAALDATAGSFYTDGTTLYLHPFNDTNPISDGNTYTRSINRNGGLAAVDFSAGNFLANGFYIRKTALVDQNNNDFGAYCLQDGVLAGTGMSSEVENSYLAYGDKHCFGSTTGVTNSSLLVLNTECEQGQPYCTFGGQSPFVSYSGMTTGDVEHTYMGCTCLTRSGLIGSAAGDPVGSGGDIILSHNNGTGASFGTITIDNCNFGSGTIDINGAQNLVVTDHSQTAEIYTTCPSTAVNETTFTSQIAQMGAGATKLTLQNCLIKPVFALSATHPAYYGLLLSGNCSVEGCTFDLSGLTGNSSTYFPEGIIERTGPLQLLFRNNVYLVPSNENFPPLYGMASTDTLTFDHNAYNLGGGTVFARNLDSTASVTFSQWQSLGQDDVNSSLNANLDLQNDVPQAGSPLLNGGVNLGAEADFTGTLYPDRNTIGAYEGSSTYLPAQTISDFPALQSAYQGTPVTLTATTNASLPITYGVVSGPGQLSGTTLTFTGTGTVVLTASQAGNGSNAPVSEVETITVNAGTAPAPATDTPTLPPWALALLGSALAWAAARGLRPSGSPTRG